MKRNKSLGLGQAVRVCWTDSFTRPGWLNDYDNPTPYHIVTQGFVSANTKNVLGIAASMSVTAAVLDPVHIPWTTIESVKKLGKKWNR